MKRTLHIILSVIIFSLLTNAQNANITQNANVAVKTTPEKPKTKILGQVIYEDTGKPVRRSPLKFFKLTDYVGKSDRDEDYKGKSLQTFYPSSVITNDNGEFVIEIEAGEYYPSVEVSGVLNPSNSETLYKSFGTISTELLDQLFEKIVVIEGVREQQVLIRAKRGGAISGRIFYSDGEPAIDVQVETLRMGEYGFENVSSTKTDDRGFYRFANLPQGKYIVRITERTFRKAENYYGNFPSYTSEIKTYYGDTINIKNANILEILPPEEKSEINITLSSRKTFTVSGTVISKSTKKPIKGARISFENNEESNLISYQTRYSSTKVVIADEKGNFSIEDLPKGNYIFKISPPYEYNYSQETDETRNKKEKEPKLAEARKEIIIEDKDLENIALEMPIASKISGTLVFEDKREIKNTYFTIFDEEKELTSSTSFDEYTYEEVRKSKPTQWNFVISDVAEGNYIPYIGQFNGSEDFYAKSITINGQDWLNSSFEIKENVEIKDVKIVLATDIGTIKGKIEVGDIELLKNSMVILIPIKKPNARTLFRYLDVSENGEFEGKLAPGEYFLIVHYRNSLIEDRKTKHEEWLEKITKDAEKVIIKPNETTSVTVRK